MTSLAGIDEAALLAALNDRRVLCAFQPIVAADTHAVHHHECLLRIRADDGNLLPPAPFIAAAEAADCVHLLDHRMLENAARAMVGQGDLHLALNLSVRTVVNPRAACGYLDALKALGRAASRLTLELTETVAVEDPVLAADFSRRARALGCRFAIDDFGAGYTSFRNLLAIEADSVKIDGSFVDGVTEDARARTFIRMMVDLTQTFGVDTVAERVETAEEADVLRELGVDYLQGYHFGKPSLRLTKQAA